MAMKNHYKTKSARKVSVSIVDGKQLTTMIFRLNSDE